MTQVNSAQPPSDKVASTPHARRRTLAQRRADTEEQIRSWLANDPHMALTEPEHVKTRMKDLRKRSGLKQYEVATALGEPPRTFQSWENAEVETDREKYEKVARFYSTKLGVEVTANWILFGQDDEPPLATPNLMGAMETNGNQPDLEAELAEIHTKLDALLVLAGLDPNGDLPEQAAQAAEEVARATASPRRGSARGRGAS